MVFLFGSCACFASFEILQSVQCLNLVKRISCCMGNSRAGQCAHRGRIQKWKRHNGGRVSCLT